MGDLRVCFAGDSYVAGFGDASGLGWVGRVVVAGLRAGLPLTAYNLGVRGDTSALIRDRVAGEVRPRVDAAADARVVLSFGVNDTIMVDGAPRTALPETLAALRDMVTALAPVPLLVVGPVAVDDAGHNARLRALGDALAEECSRSGVPFVATFDATLEDEVWRREVARGDGYHPSALGYERLTAVVGAPVLAWLSAPAGASGSDRPT